MIEETKKISNFDATEVVATLKGFEQRLIRHVEGGDVIERAFNNLSMQPRNNSHTSNSKNMKFWKNKKKKGF